MKTGVEGIGVALYDEEHDYIQFDGGDDLPDTPSCLFAAAGAETVPLWLEGALSAVEGERHGKDMADDHPFKRTVEDYRAKTGRRFPNVYRIKISVELEELPTEEAEAFWVRQRNR